MQTTYSAVSVDNIDGAGSVAAHQAYFDKIEAIREGQLEAYGGPEFIDAVLYGDAYRYQAAYHSAMLQQWTLLTEKAIGTKISVANFKSFVKDLTVKVSCL